MFGDLKAVAVRLFRRIREPACAPIVVPLPAHPSRCVIAESIDVVFADPVLKNVSRVSLETRRILAQIGEPPVLAEEAVEVRAGLVVQPVKPVQRRLVVHVIQHHIHHNRQAPLVSLVHQLLELLRCSIGGFRREVESRIVSPAHRAGELRDRQGLNRRDAKPLDVVELRDDPREALARAKIRQEELVDQKVVERRPAKRRVRPFEFLLPDGQNAPGPLGQMRFFALVAHPFDIARIRIRQQIRAVHAILVPMDSRGHRTLHPPRAIGRVTHDVCVRIPLVEISDHRDEVFPRRVKREQNASIFLDRGAQRRALRNLFLPDGRHTPESHFGHRRLPAGIRPGRQLMTAEAQRLDFHGPLEGALVDVRQWLSVEPQADRVGATYHGRDDKVVREDTFRGREGKEHHGMVGPGVPGDVGIVVPAKISIPPVSPMHGHVKGIDHLLRPVEGANENNGFAVFVGRRKRRIHRQAVV